MAMKHDSQGLARSTGYRNYEAGGQCGEDLGELSPPVGGGGPGKFSYFRC